MRKETIESRLRRYVKENLSPTMDDIQFVSKIYESFTDVLGVTNCVQIGSFPRYTAIKPLHDLDILYRIGEWNEDKKQPQNILKDLAKKFEKEYKNPTRYRLNFRVQSHSVSFTYTDNKGDVVFAVDIVPAINRGTNEYGNTTFWVPEIIKVKSVEKRQKFYAEKRNSHQAIQWIKTDPIGYIHQAAQINSENTDFRKAVKFIKGWKNHCKELNEDFKLKSFHLEQLITEQLKKKPSQTVFDSIFQCLSELKGNIDKPCIKDRADPDKFIDDYVGSLTKEQKDLITEAVDAVLIALEEFSGDVEKLLGAGYYQRKTTEKYLFDHSTPILVDEDIPFEVDAWIKKASGYGAFNQRLSTTGGQIEKNNSLQFFVDKGKNPSFQYAWKIKNDNNCVQPRGDLHLKSNSTWNETTSFYGGHYAECFAIKDGECVARGKANVLIFEKKNWNKMI